MPTFERDNRLARNFCPVGQLLLGPIISIAKIFDPVFHKPPNVKLALHILTLDMRNIKYTLHCFSVTSQSSGGCGVSWACFARPRHPAPPFIEKLRFSFLPQNNPIKDRK